MKANRLWHNFDGQVSAGNVHGRKDNDNDGNRRAS